MSRHVQQYLADPARGDGHTSDGMPGDCMRAAVASALDLDPADLEHYALTWEDGRWFDVMRRDARRFGRDWVFCDPPPAEQGNGTLLPDGLLVVAGGPSPRGPFGHVAVYRVCTPGEADGAPITYELWHDPHPSGLGLAEVQDAMVPVAPYSPPPRQLALPAAAS